LGNFLREAQKQPWYAHTLMVLVADHGHHLPGSSANQSPRKFRIPLLFAGGALRPEVRGRVVSTIGSQTDVPATLLRQLGLPDTAFPWSRDLLAPHPFPFAFYCYNNGFGAVSAAGAVAFDNVSRQVTNRSALVPSIQLELGKAMQQLTLQDFAKK
jgi:phosphoglycerol transferase MdoB-like AlkP superfamily enzyme